MTWSTVTERIEEVEHEGFVAAIAVMAIVVTIVAFGATIGCI